MKEIPLALLAAMSCAAGCMVGETPSVDDAVFDPASDDGGDLYPVGDTPELDEDAPAIDYDTPEPTLAFAAMTSASTDIDRATAAWHALTAHLKTGTPGLFWDNTNAIGRDKVSVWGLGQVLAGALDRAELSNRYADVQHVVAALKLYKQNGHYRATLSGADVYWDDNAWLGLDFMQAYVQTHDNRFKKLALDLYPFVRKGMHTADDDNKCAVAFQVGQTPSYGAVATGAAGMLAARLYLRTNDKRFLDDAKCMYGWMRTHMRRNNDSNYPGIYSERRSYDDGVGIGLPVLLYRATGEQHYLDDAIETANAALDCWGSGVCTHGFFHDWSVFDAIFFRNLLALDRIAPDPSYRARIESYVQRAWSDGRDPATNLFEQGRGGLVLYGDGTPSGQANALDQGGFVQMYALLAWPIDDLRKVD